MRYGDTNPGTGGGRRTRSSTPGRSQARGIAAEGRPPRLEAEGSRPRRLGFPGHRRRLAAVALVVPLAGSIPHVLITVIHELGHVATAWLFGSPSVPSFDLTYGGGFSHRFAQQPLLLVAIYAAFAALAFRKRDDWPALIAFLVAVALYSAAVFSSLRDLLIIAMGHGAELLFAGVFLYRAVSGSQILRSEERPLYAFLGLYIVLADARFAYLLITSPEHREEYGLAKGGGDWMDFSRIANEHLHVRLETVAALFLLACAVTPLAVFLVHRYGHRRK